MLYIIIVAVIGLIADQVSKVAAVNFFGGQIGIDQPVIQNILHFTYVENRGAAFGIMQNAQLFFLILTVVAFAGGVFALCKVKHKHWILKLSSGLLFGGAIGNLIDRLFLGYVRDFIDFRFLQHFAVFNIADSCIVVGTALLAVYMLFIHDKYQKKFADAESENDNQSGV